MRERLSLRRIRIWMPAAFWIILFTYSVWPWLPWNSRNVRQVVLYGFSILGEPLTQVVLPAFQKDWENRTGETVEFASSFAGSGTVTNQLLMGVPAQLALLSLESDRERLARAGLTKPDAWKLLPYKGVVNRTPLVILVRPGNPKGIRGFHDLAKPGVRIVHPDPLTSGAANWAILAEYGAGMRQNPTDPEQGGYELLLGIWRNVVAQAQSARTARMQFENGFGDALVTYEQEALWDRARGGLRSEVVYPPSTILSENILVLLDRNIDPGQRKIMRSLVDFFWSERTQRLFIDTGFRSVDETLNEKGPGFGKIADPFLVSSLGGWDAAKSRIVDRVWKGRVLKQLRPQP